MSTAALELLISLKDEASAGLGSITGSLGGLGKATLAVAGGGLLAPFRPVQVNPRVHGQQPFLRVTSHRRLPLARERGGLGHSCENRGRSYGSQGPGD
jgi:hypothetical protein